MRLRTVVILGYVLVIGFLIGAWSMQIVPEFIEQQAIFAALSTLSNAEEGQYAHAEKVLFDSGYDGMLYLLQELLRKPHESNVELRGDEVYDSAPFRERFRTAQFRVARLARQIVTHLRESGEAFKPGKVYTANERLAEDTTLMELWRGRDDAIVINQMVTLLSLLPDPKDPAAEQLVEALVAIGDPAIPGMVIQLKREKVDPVFAQPTATQTKAERERELNELNQLARLRVVSALEQIATPRAVSELEAHRNVDDPVVAKAVRGALAEILENNPDAAATPDAEPQQ